MRVVVDIPGWLYNAIMECKEPHYSKSLGEAVRDGTPLPKGYGRLIDADAYEADIKKHYFDNRVVIRCTEIGLNNAPTVIEADKEESEDKE